MSVILFNIFLKLLLRLFSVIELQVMYIFHGAWGHDKMFIIRNAIGVDQVHVYN